MRKIFELTYSLPVLAFKTIFAWDGYLYPSQAKRITFDSGVLFAAASVFNPSRVERNQVFAQPSVGFGEIGQAPSLHQPRHALVMRVRQDPQLADPINLSVLLQLLPELATDALRLESIFDQNAGFGRRRWRLPLTHIVGYAHDGR